MKFKLTRIPEPQVVLNAAEVVHLTDDLLKTFCGLTIGPDWRTGGVPRSLCGSCRRSADGHARLKRFL